MTCTMFKEFLLFFILHHVWSEAPEPTFREKGNTIEMGYCFGVDYIVVYRSTPEGDQLLGNSSNNNLPNTPPADLQGRTNISGGHDLLGLQIRNLTHLDTGIYRTECWKNNTLVSNHTQHLSVCNKEMETEEIIWKEEGRAEIRCNSPFIGHEGISLLWYSEIFPHYKQTLFLNTSVSLEPLVKDLPGVTEIRDNGSLLVIDKSVFTNNQHFHCLVIQDMKCLSFQNMEPQDNSESRDIFVSPGDRVRLHCPANGKKQQWDTPLGRPDGNNMILDSQMSISVGDGSEDFSLVITNVSDEHSGPYSCISSSLEMAYVLYICHKQESRKRFVHVGESVLLRCGSGLNISQRVQWFRHEPSGQHELIFDSDDKTAPSPEDLIDRMNFSQNGYSLEINDLVINDGRKYWCVVLSGNEFLEHDFEYPDYDKETETEDDFDDGDEWYDEPKCIFKEDIFLNVSVKKPLEKGGRGWRSDIEPVTFSSGVSATTAVPSSESNTSVVTVVVVLVVLLLVVGVIVAVMVIKKRTKPSQKERGATADESINMDPGCTQGLTSGEGAI